MPGENGGYHPEQPMRNLDDLPTDRFVALTREESQELRKRVKSQEDQMKGTQEAPKNKEIRPGIKVIRENTPRMRNLDSLDVHKRQNLSGAEINKLRREIETIKQKQAQEQQLAPAANSYSKANTPLFNEPLSSAEKKAIERKPFRDRIKSFFSNLGSKDTKTATPIGYNIPRTDGTIDSGWIPIRTNQENGYSTFQKKDAEGNLLEKTLSPQMVEQYNQIGKKEFSK